MDAYPGPPVLIAVESAENAGAALEFGEREAARLQCGLSLLHALNTTVYSGSDTYVFEDLVGPAEEMLRTLAKRAEERLGGSVPVTWEVARGPAVRTVVERSADSRIVVVQGAEKGRLERLVTGQVRNGIAARAHAPVVCVPAGWTPRSDRRGPVVVGVDDPQPDPRLLRLALACAAERDVPLRVFHAWWFVEPLDDTAFTSFQAQRWCLQMEHTLRTAVDRLVEDDGDVLATPDAIDVRAVHERPADGLVEQSRDAELLVVGRRDPQLPLRSHLGPVVRAVLQRAECPVMVVEPAQSIASNGSADEE
jgi:nucleotide-binding universal stress UspA family protein